MFYLEKIGGMDSSPQQQDRVTPLVLKLYLVNVDPESPLEISLETLPFNLRKPERRVNDGTYPGSLDRPLAILKLGLALPIRQGLNKVKATQNGEPGWGFGSLVDLLSIPGLPSLCGMNTCTGKSCGVTSGSRNPCVDSAHPGP